MTQEENEKLQAKITQIIKDTALLNLLCEMVEIHSTSLIGVMNQREKMLFKSALRAWRMFYKSVKRGVDNVYMDAVDEDGGKLLDIIDYIFENHLEDLDSFLAEIKNKPLPLENERRKD